MRLIKASLTTIIAEGRDYSTVIGKYMKIPLRDNFVLRLLKKIQVMLKEHLEDPCYASNLQRLHRKLHESTVLYIGRRSAAQYI